MDALCQVLQQDRADAEIASYVLDTLKLVMNNEIYEEEGKNDRSIVGNISVGITLNVFSTGLVLQRGKNRF